MNDGTMQKRKTGLILAGLMLALLLAALDSTIVGTAMKRIIDDLNGLQLYAWPFTIYMLTSTVAIPISGGLADLYGRKPVFILGIAVFLVGSALCGLSHDMMQLIIFRGIQGVGGGIVVSSVFIVVADLFPPEKRGTYTGIVTSMYGLASVIGPLLGGAITDSIGWRWIFYINVPIGLAAGIILLAAMPGFRYTGEKKRIDVVGTVLLVLTLVPMLLAFSDAGKEFAWGSWQIIGLFAFSAVMLVLFVLIEARSDNPIVPVRLLRNRAINTAVLLAFFTNGLMFAAIMFIPYFVQGVIGTSATTSGAITMPMMLGLLIASNFSGFLASKTGKSRLTSAMAFVLVTLAMWLLSGMTTATSYGTVILFMVILGLGIGIAMPIGNINAQNAAPREKIGAVTAVVQFSRNIGSTIGSAVYGTILTTSMNRGYAGLDMSRLPEQVRSALGNIQVLTDRAAIAAIEANVPAAYRDYVGKLLTDAKGVLAQSIHDVFFFCIFAAAAGVVVALLLKDTPRHVQGPGTPKGVRSGR